MIRQAPAHQALDFVQAGLWICLGAISGGRLVYTTIHSAYYRTHSLEILQVFQGGLAWQGALAGALLAFVLYALIARQSPGNLADGLLPLAVCLTGAACMGCWLEGCGSPGAAPFPGESTAGQAQPPFVWAAVMTLLWFWVVERLRQGHLARVFPPGAAASLGLLSLAVLLYYLLPLGAQPVYEWQGRSLDTWLVLGLAGIASICLAAVWLAPLAAKLRARQ